MVQTVEGQNGFDRANSYLGDLEGTITIKIPKSHYTAEIHLGDNYMKNLPALIAEATIIKATVFQMGIDEARDMMIHHMDAKPDTPDLEIPSAIFYRYDQSPVYVGYATGRLYPVDTTRGRRNLLTVTRTITAKHQTHGLGTFSVQELRALHPKATDIGFRSRSPAAVRAAMLADVVREDELSPWFKRYTSDPDFFNHQLMMHLWYRIHKLGATPDIETGVSRNDYIDENRAYEYRPDRTQRALSTIQIAALMEEFDMGPLDSAYSVGPLK